MTARNPGMWLAVAVAGGWLTGAALAADVTFQADVNSAYVWRGITYNDGVVVQPSLDLSLPEGFAFNVWGNFDVEDYDGARESGEFSEVDLDLSRSLAVNDRLSVSFGLIEYLYPHQAADGSREAYVSSECDLGAGVSADASLSYDWDEADGFYGSAGVTYTRDVNEDLSADVSASVGAADSNWAEYNSGGKDAGFHDFNLSVGVVYRVTDAIEAGATIAYTDNIDKDVLPEPDTNLYGGVSLACQF